MGDLRKEEGSQSFLHGSGRENGPGSRHEVGVLVASRSLLKCCGFSLAMLKVLLQFIY